MSNIKFEDLSEEINKKIEYNVYIDESGDEGIAKGSKYFILTAVLVKKENDLQIAKSVDKIKTNLQIPQTAQLHWNTVKGIPNKKMIIEEACKQDIIVVNVIIDTKTIKYIPSKEMYYHFSGYLIGKICDIMKHNNGIANLMISARSQIIKEDYVKYLKRHNSRKKITIDRIKLTTEDIKIYQNKQKRLLQLADCCCSSLGQALKYNDEVACDIYEPLIKKCHSYSGNYHKHGFIFVPYETLPNKFNLINKICIESQNSKKAQKKQENA